MVSPCQSSGVRILDASKKPPTINTSVLDMYPTRLGSLPTPSPQRSVVDQVDPLNPKPLVADVTCHSLGQTKTLPQLDSMTAPPLLSPPAQRVPPSSFQILRIYRTYALRTRVPHRACHNTRKGRKSIATIPSCKSPYAGKSYKTERAEKQGIQDN